MKKIILSAAAVVLLLATVGAHAGGNWSLINSQYSGGTWYCTYQLNGTSVQKTIASSSNCPTYILGI